MASRRASCSSGVLVTVCKIYLACVPTGLLFVISAASPCWVVVCGTIPIVVTAAYDCPLLNLKSEILEVFRHLCD